MKAVAHVLVVAAVVVYALTVAALWDARALARLAYARGYAAAVDSVRAVPR